MKLHMAESVKPEQKLPPLHKAEGWLIKFAYAAVILATVFMVYHGFQYWAGEIRKEERMQLAKQARTCMWVLAIDPKTGQPECRKLMVFLDMRDPTKKPEER